MSTSAILLPAELWQQIFSYLSYLHLKTSIRLVCRLFNAYLLPPSSPTSRTALDVALFRDYPSSSPVISQKYELHPALTKRFELLSHDYAGSTKEICKWLTKDLSSMLGPTFVDHLRRENATSPASRMVVVMVKEGHMKGVVFVIDSISDRGVGVQDVPRAELGEVWKCWGRL